MGDTVVLDEYIDYVTDGEYTIKAIKGELNSNLSKRKSWEPSEPGEWTIEYKINGGKHKGEYSIELNVVAPKLGLVYTVTNDNSTAELGTTLNFETFFSTSGINVTIDSWYENCTVKMESVLIDGERTYFTENDTSFTFTKRTNHYFRFVAESPDGQKKTGVVEVKVVYTDPVAQQFITNNNVKVYGYGEFDKNLKLTLNSGTHSSGFSNNDIPYIAYNGNYGVGSFVKFDFTGNNLPRVAFFVDDVTPSIVDGNKGLYIANGHTFNGGQAVQEAEYKSLTAYGPNKVSSQSFTNSDPKLNTVGSPGNPAAISKSQLEDGVKYRYVLGFTGAEETTVKPSETKEGYSGYATYRALLVNLDSGEIVFDYEGKCVIKQAQYDANLKFKQGYFSGSIVAYGGFGGGVVIDKVYPVSTDVTDIYALTGCEQMKTSCDKYYSAYGSFKSSTHKYARINEELSVGDYIINDGAEYEFGYIKESDIDYSADVFASDKFVKVTADKFSINAIGEYRLYYREKSSGKHFASMNLTVLDGVMTYDFEDGVSDMITIEGSGSVSYKKNIDKTTYSSTTLKISLPPIGDQQLFQIRFAKEYLEKMFEDENVYCIKADVLLDVDRTVTVKRNGGTSDENIAFTANEWQTISVDRASYEHYVSEQKGLAYTLALLVRGIGGTPDDLFYMYLDNIRAERKNIVYVSDYTTNDFTLSLQTNNISRATINGSNLIANTDYTFENGVMTIKNATLKNIVGENDFKVYNGEELVYLSILEVVTDKLDFEDGRASSAITKTVGGTFSVIKSDALDGEYLYGVTKDNQSTSTIKVYFDYNYWAKVFEDSSVEYLAFDIKTPYGLAQYGTRGSSGNMDLLSISQDGVMTLGIPRSAFEWMVNNNKTGTDDAYISFTTKDVEGNWDKCDYIYIDNIRPYKLTDNDLVISFDDGVLTSMISTGDTNDHYNLEIFEQSEGNYVYGSKNAAYGKTVKINISTAYVKAVFANQDVEYLAFDVILGDTVSEGWHAKKIGGKDLTELSNNDGVITLGLSKSDYQNLDLSGDNVTLELRRANNITGTLSYADLKNWGIDNFRPYTNTSTSEK